MTKGTKTVLVGAVVVGLIWSMRGRANAAAEMRALVADPIFFQFDSFELTDESKLRLTAFSGLWKTTQLEIRITGHADFTGTEDYNRLLSLRRAEIVADYLTRLGVAPAKIISIEGVGASFPQGDNNTEEGRALNRRVDVAI